MPRYNFICDTCGQTIEVVRSMDKSDESWKCLCGHNMRRDFKAEAVRVGVGEYRRPIQSDSLAISPRQRAEHEKLFPNIKLDDQCRPVFDNFRDHEAYLQKTGFQKLSAKKKRKGKRII